MASSAANSAVISPCFISWSVAARHVSLGCAIHPRLAADFQTVPAGAKPGCPPHPSSSLRLPRGWPRLDSIWQSHALPS
eukprot:scaffold18350_cov112-Isochrysis_galbana.AAC.2